MNYIVIRWAYGRKSMEMVVNTMKEPCNILAKKNNGRWYQYTTEMKMWTEISEYILRDILHSGSNSIINWGNYIFGNNKLFKLNIPDAVLLASNKRESRKVLQNAGVAVPKTYFDQYLNWTSSAHYPVVVRPAHHHGGKNFDVFSDEISLTAFLWGKSGWYASEIFTKTHEYRVHVAHGKILLINEKPLVEGELRANHIVNHEEWRALKWSEFNPKICEESVKAVKELGLDYGAVDIMYNSANNSVAICEVNTSPSITTPYSSGKYAQYFDWCIRHNFPEHFPVEGKSVFYNEILRS